MTKTTKAAAWRWAARVLRDEVSILLPPEEVADHVLNVIVPSLERRAEIIERRVTRETEK